MIIDTETDCIGLLDRLQTHPRQVVKSVRLDTLTPFQIDIATIKAREAELRMPPSKTVPGTKMSAAKRRQAIHDYILRRGLQAWDSLRRTSENALCFGEQDPTFEKEESVFYDLSLLLVLFPKLKEVYLAPLDFRQWNDGRYTRREGSIYIKWPPSFVAPVNGCVKARGMCLFPVVRFFGKWLYEKEQLTFKDCILLHRTEPEEQALPAAGPVAESTLSKKKAPSTPKQAKRASMKKRKKRKG
jgi:hypothetical protein